MKNCIITSTNRKGSCASTSVMVHARNALTISKALGMDLIEGEEDAHLLQENKYDNIICNYASFYMPWKAYYDHIMAQPDARLWWMVNDHDVEDNILLRNILKTTDCKRKYGVISNNTRKGFRQWILRKWIDKGKVRLDDCIDEWHTVNLNALTFEDYTLRGTAPQNEDWFYEEYPAVYWGSWRKWREPYFKKYSHKDIYFSTSPKNKVKVGGQYRFIPPITWGEYSILANTNATVYLEDPHTHDNYAFPANRFYEALSYNINVGVDESCRSNAEKFGYKGLIFINSPEELLELANDWQPNPTDWVNTAQREKEEALDNIDSIMQ